MRGRTYWGSRQPSYMAKGGFVVTRKLRRRYVRSITATTRSVGSFSVDMALIKKSSRSAG